tara:strand:- start:87 stop:662 length:576 start_codon:yes stop_codon:yes gene_type:complete
MSSIKLTADSGGGTFEIKAPSSSGNTRILTLPDTGNLTLGKTGILQVVQTIKKDQFSTSQVVGSGYADITGLSVAITPSATSSKIMLMCTLYNSNNAAVNFFRILRGSTFIEQPSGTSSSGANWNAHGFAYYDHSFQDTTVINILDSPSTTSATTYKVQAACTSNAVTINKFYNTSNYYGLTTLTAMEIAG